MGTICLHFNVLQKKTIRNELIFLQVTPQIQKRRFDMGDPVLGIYNDVITEREWPLTRAPSKMGDASKSKENTKKNPSYFFILTFGVKNPIKVQFGKSRNYWIASSKTKIKLF